MRHRNVVTAGALAAALILGSTINLMASKKPALPPHRGHPSADFALLNEPAVTTGVATVQCGARGGPFMIHVTMTNRTDLGGADGKLRVTYKDGDFVDYWIPANSTMQITLAGGGTAGVDDIIMVSGDGTGGSVLVGQMSLYTAAAKPHPFLPGQGADNKVDDFCTTLP